MKDTFKTRGSLQVGSRSYSIAKLSVLAKSHPKSAKLPYSLKILLENLLRTEDGETVTAGDVEALVNWDPKAVPTKEIHFTPARVLLQDFTGFPCVVDLAAMRDAMKRKGGDPRNVQHVER